MQYSFRFTPDAWQIAPISEFRS